MEQTYCTKREMKQCSRLSDQIEIQCRNYSSLLQRAMVDFGADESFERASEKLQEHYGIEVSSISIKRKTYFHGAQMNLMMEQQTDLPKKGTTDMLISESDGTMIPLVEIKQGSGDARKRRSIFWKEAISTLAYAKGSKTPTYVATLDGRDQAGLAMLHTAICAGAGENSYVHIVGDGAKWIEEKAQEAFGTQGHYLIDFYHLCDYLAKAVEASNIKNKPSYLGRLKALCKKGKIDQVIQWLSRFEEASSVKSENAPVRAAIRYITNRPGQFDYPTALKNELPIGSGEIESTHRHLIQKRMKIAGAWWKLDNARNMLELRSHRANNNWDQYWRIKKAA